MAPASHTVPRRAPTAADLLLLAFLVAVMAWLPLQRRGKAKAERLWVSSASGDRALDLRRDQDVILPGPEGETLLRIRDGSAWIAASPCRLHLCESMAPIRHCRGTLVCVPNRIAVRVGGGIPAVDGVTR